MPSELPADPSRWSDGQRFLYDPDARADTAVSGGLRDAIWAAFDALTDNERYVIECVFFERLTQQEIAERMQFRKADGTVKSYSDTTVYRLRESGLKKMRAALEGHPDLQRMFSDEG
jgi:DNA-directed RNA polymerase specialized sigma subunit